MDSNRRFKTREVKIGQVIIGGNSPICIQSMTTTPTHEVDLTVDQILKLEQAGAQIVRVTVQGMKEAYACERIKTKLSQLRCSLPIVADIHFFPQAAITVVDFVDKVRINPGNFADKRAIFSKKEYDQNSYALEIEKIEEKFFPLIEKCKTQKKPIRIGVNHGSLSDRIMSYYGDTPIGMIQSCFEYVEIARKYHFHDLVISMKSSSTKVMVDSYRLLVKEMKEKGFDYPLHLGVTEAGFGLDGRVKSSIGIGTLLLEGIGDTIRMSLTEDPMDEIAPCKKLVSFIQQHQKFDKQNGDRLENFERIISPFKESYTVWSQVQKKEDLSKIQADVLVADYPLDTSKVVLHPQNSLFGSMDRHDSKLKIHVLSSMQEMNQLPKLEDLLMIDLFDFNFFDLKIAIKELKKRYGKPIILRASVADSSELEIIEKSTLIGSLLIDDLIDGIYFDGFDDKDFKESLAFSILQGARKRSSKTEFISCPSCGRTLFDLQTVTREIQKYTKHLKDVKIAVMGCIVNGPGEMADADFGYVGSKPGKIDLYVGKSCIERDIDQQVGAIKLIELIKNHGKWVDP